MIGPETKLLDALAQRASLDQQAGNCRHQSHKGDQKGGGDDSHQLSMKPSRFIVIFYFTAMVTFLILPVNALSPLA